MRGIFGTESVSIFIILIENVTRYHTKDDISLSGLSYFFIAPKICRACLTYDAYLVLLCHNLDTYSTSLAFCFFIVKRLRYNRSTKHHRTSGRFGRMRYVMRQASIQHFPIPTKSIRSHSHLTPLALLPSLTSSAFEQPAASWEALHTLFVKMYRYTQYRSHLLHYSASSQM